MKDPHIGVFVREMQSHPVSVMGAVRKPAFFQIRGNKTLLEILSLRRVGRDAGEEVYFSVRRSEQYARALSEKANDVTESSPAMRLQESDSAAGNGWGTEKSNSFSENVVRGDLRTSSIRPIQPQSAYIRETSSKFLGQGCVCSGAVKRPGGFA